MPEPARTLRQNLIHPPFVKRFYTECSPLIQLIALVNKFKAGKNDTILVIYIYLYFHTRIWYKLNI